MWSISIPLVMLIFVEFGFLHPSTDNFLCKTVFWLVWFGSYFLLAFLQVSLLSNQSDDLKLQISNLESDTKNSREGKAFSGLLALLLPGAGHVAAGAFGVLLAADEAQKKEELTQKKSLLDNIEKKITSYITASFITIFVFTIIIIFHN